MRPRTIRLNTVGTRDWMENASCVNRPDLDWFDIACCLQPCLAICATCQVADDCLEYAKQNRIYEGIWGGQWGYGLMQHVKGRAPGRDQGGPG